MSSHAGRKDDLSVWSWTQHHDRDPHWLLSQLPHTIQAPASCELRAEGDGGGWQITLRLAPSDQAGLEAMQPSAYALCAAAQYALGLAAIGSQHRPGAGHHHTARERSALADVCGRAGVVVGCQCYARDTARLG
jgi:hypothetical protein